MIIRAVATVVALALGIYAFWGDVMGAGHVLNPFGILFLLLAGLIWVAWEPIRESFKSAKESELPVLRMGYMLLRGMGGPKHGEHRQRPRS